MNIDKPTILATGGATLVCLLSWVFLPSLQSGARKVETAAELRIERARRMLHEYDPGLTYRAGVVEQLSDAEVDVEKLDGVADDAAEEYEAAHGSMWTAFSPVDFGSEKPRPAKPTYGNIASQIRDGLKSRTALTAQNGQLLKDAQAEIEAALSEGGDSGAILAEATRLKAVILYHRGLAERVRAGLRRSQADDHRRGLVRAVNQAAQWTTAKNLVVESEIDVQIKATQSELDKVESQLGQEQKELTALESKIREMETGVAAARAEADKARESMEKLQRDGVDFSDVNGSETFARKIGELDSAYRAAIRKVQTLEAGDLPKAQIDASGDFLRGRYLENGSPTNLTLQPGLTHFRDERTALSAVVEGRKQAVADLRADLKRLEGIRSANESAQVDAVRRIEEAGPQAAAAFEEINRIESEAVTIEDSALKFLDQAAATALQAANEIDQWISRAKEKTQNLAPEGKERSAFTEAENDDWMAGHAAAQAADAKLEKAWIYYDRFAAATENARILAEAKKTLDLNEADPAAEETKANEARTKGVEEVAKAMDILEKSHRRTERHWTLTAQAAGTAYLMSLFGNADYTADAVEGYRAALKGRETEKFTEKLAARLKKLESR